MLLAALVIPGQVGMLPLFLMLKAMGLVNTMAGVVVPFMAGIFGIFMIRQYALSHPRRPARRRAGGRRGRVPHLLDHRAAGDPARSW